MIEHLLAGLVFFGQAFLILTVISLVTWLLSKTEVIVSCVVGWIVGFASGVAGTLFAGLLRMSRGNIDEQPIRQEDDGGKATTTEGST